MKSLHSLIRQSSLMLMAGLLLVFSVLIYVGGDALLRRFVDGRLLALAETMAKIIEQYPNIIESSGEEYALAAEVGRNEKEQHELQEVTHSLRVFSPDGRVVWKGSRRGGTAAGVRSTRCSNKFVSGTPCLKPLSRPMARLFDICSFLFPAGCRCGTFCMRRHPCSFTRRHSTVS